jgi:rhodanese-related sulfurtransferase
MMQVPVTALVGRLRAERAAGRQPQLLDVREPWEIALASLSLPEAPTQAIPMQQIPLRLAELDPAQPLFVLCHHGMRSLQVTMFLRQHGYPHTYNIADGIDAWSRQVDPGVPSY